MFYSIDLFFLLITFFQDYLSVFDLSACIEYKRCCWYIRKDIDMHNNFFGGHRMKKVYTLLLAAIFAVSMIPMVKAADAAKSAKPAQKTAAVQDDSKTSADKGAAKDDKKGKEKKNTKKPKSKKPVKGQNDKKPATDDSAK
jgi:hypothetical protein